MGESGLAPEILQELLRRIAAGCQEAFTTLHACYNRTLVRSLRRRYLKRHHPLRRDIDPADLTQVTWMALSLRLRQGATFADERELLRFLQAVAANEFRAYYRSRMLVDKRSQRREESLDLTLHDRPATRGDGLDPAALVAAQDEYEHLLAGLTIRQRELLCQPSHEGRPAQEQAERRALLTWLASSLLRGMSVLPPIRVRAARPRSVTCSRPLVFLELSMPTPPFPDPADYSTPLSPRPESRTFAQAVALYQAGQAEQAEELLWKLVQADSQDAASLHLLGVIAFRRRRFATARDWFHAAVNVRPHDAHTLSCLGAACQELGHSEEALTWHQAAQQLAPADPLVLNSLGITLQRLERIEEAAAAFAAARHADPRDAALPCNLGAALALLGQTAEAVAAYREALALRPDLVEAHHGLGDLLGLLGRFGEAEACYRQVVRLRPHHAIAHRRLGDLLQQRGRPDEAVAAYRHAVALTPADGEVQGRLSLALLALNRVAEAVACGQEAVRLNPTDAEAQNQLGNALHASGDLSRAAGCYEQAALLRPDWSVPRYNLGVALLGQGRLREAHTQLAEAVRQNPTDAVAASTAVGSRHYDPEAEGPELLTEARRWAQTHAGQLEAPSSFTNLADPQRRLRVGYISPDFRAHAVAYFLEPILTHHDPAQVEVCCYADVTAPDAMTSRLRRRCGRWQLTSGLSHVELAQHIHADGIDVLVDLCGHLAGSRLLTFARRPAPVQISYLGYPGTTGLDAIGYRLADAVIDPPEEPAYYAEELVRLPGCFCCYAPPPEAPALPAEPPVRRQRVVTFGSLHKLEKLNDQVLQLWHGMLAEVPGSRLLFARHTLRGETVDYWQQRLVEHGFDLARVELRHVEAVAMRHLEVYADIDIVLDVFPWSGHTTACEALWMGVPVITLRGNRAATRMTASVLTHLGLQEWVAEDPDDYRRIATNLAADTACLTELRRTLRGRLRASRLCDGAAFTRGLEATYRTLWRRWCASPRRARGLERECLTKESLV
jgi:predicted O-linked N-acetylglucosamine transferase (SPINDLY family)